MSLCREECLSDGSSQAWRKAGSDFSTNNQIQQANRGADFPLLLLQGHQRWGQFLPNIANRSLLIPWSKFSNDLQNRGRNLSNSASNLSCSYMGHRPNTMQHLNEPTQCILYISIRTTMPAMMAVESQWPPFWDNSEEILQQIQNFSFSHALELLDLFPNPALVRYSRVAHVCASCNDPWHGWWYSFP